MKPRQIHPGLLDAVAPAGAENFITNALCWLLSNVPGLGTDFLGFLRENQCQKGNSLRNIPCLEEENLGWDTQTPFSREGHHPLYPDMTCSDGTQGVIFEHKTGTNLRDGQLSDYREYATGCFRDAPIVLITAHPGQHRQSPDLALCWSDIHAFLAKCCTLDNAGFAVREFQTLLERRGLGPMTKLNVQDVRNYRPLERTLNAVLASVAQRWNGDGYRKVRSEWGRLGFMVRGDQHPFSVPDCPSWDPGVFVGVLLDGWDHCVPNRPCGPDACVIVSVRQALQLPQGQEPEQSRCLAENLSELPDGWELYRHALDDKVIGKRYGAHQGPNPWHPLHIRRPLADVLADVDTAEDQAGRFYDETRRVVDLVLQNLEAPWVPIVRRAS